MSLQDIDKEIEIENVDSKFSDCFSTEPLAGLIDCHCHLSSNDFDKDIENVLKRAEQIGMNMFVVKKI
jgi:hypothetical protein